ncbi:MAG: hypothetical protein CUN56_14345 [Phototrophicales bacterium]|nr:MAG: hypothetical protein CUN56_14345 [Phototrophicales bacterium]
MSDVGLTPDDAISYPAYLDSIADREARTFARAADRGRDQLIAALATYLPQLDHNPAVESLRTYHRQYNDLLKRTADSPDDHYSVLMSL